MALNHRLAIIAGGLGGIGSAIGRLLRAQGAQLALLYAPFESARTQEALDSSYGGSAARDLQVYECDVSSVASVDRAFASIASDATEKSLSPTILINAAGYVALAPLEDTLPEETVKHLHYNLLGPMLASQAFARLYFRMRQQNADGDEPTPPGRIVSIASQAAHVALDKHGAYCASKAGLIGLNKCMASEWGGRAANTVSPGPVWTAMGKKAWADKTAREAYQASIPTGRFAEPDEVAAAVSFLCQDAAGMITGADIRLDGGFTAR